MSSLIQMTRPKLLRKAGKLPLQRKRLLKDAERKLLVSSKPIVTTASLTCLPMIVLQAVLDDDDEDDDEDEAPPPTKRTNRAAVLT